MLSAHRRFGYSCKLMDVAAVLKDLALRISFQVKCSYMVGVRPTESCSSLGRAFAVPLMPF